jgi:hypothetical protein
MVQNTVLSASNNPVVQDKLPIVAMFEIEM